MAYPPPNPGYPPPSTGYPPPPFNPAYPQQPPVSINNAVTLCSRMCAHLTTHLNSFDSFFGIFLGNWWPRGMIWACLGNSALVTVHFISCAYTAQRATVKAGTQEHGTEHGMEVRCKVHHDERACAHCEGAHAYRRNRQVYQLQFSLQRQPSLFVSLSVQDVEE